MKTSELSLSYSLIPLMFLIGLAHFLVDTMLGIWPIYKSMAQLDMGKAGLIVAIGALIGEGAQLLFGSLSDRGYRQFLIIVGVLMTTASAFLVYSSHYIVLFVLYLFTCIGSGSFHPCAASLVTGLVPARRALLMSIFAACGSLGLATSQLNFMVIHRLFDRHTYLLALPALVLVMFLVVYRFPPVSSLGGSGVSQHKGSLQDFRDFFRNPSLRALYFSQVANQSILWGTIFILPDTLKVLGHNEWICYGGGHFCFISGAACMMIPGGYLADAYSPRQIMLYGGVISCFIFYFILFSTGISNAIVLPALFMLGATLALMNPLAVSLGTRLEPNRSGAVSAFLMGLVWCVSEALGPGGAGLMSNLFEDYAPVKALAVLGCLFVVQIYATLCLPKNVLAVESASFV